MNTHASENAPLVPRNERGDDGIDFEFELPAFNPDSWRNSAPEKRGWFMGFLRNLFRKKEREESDPESVRRQIKALRLIAKERRLTDAEERLLETLLEDAGRPQ